jgi:hypothetical protein
MKPKKPSLQEVWEATKSQVGRTRPYGIDKQTEINTWVATYKETFCHVVPDLLKRGKYTISEIRHIVESTQDRLSIQLINTWGNGHE